MDIEEIILMHPEEIGIKPPFSDLLPPRPEVLARITESMKANGFDVAHPLHIWRQGNCLIDGHTRRQAAITAGVDVYVYIHDFDTEDDALDYAIRCQSNRRNLTDPEIVALVKVMDKRKPKGGDRKSSKAKSKTSSEGIDSAAETAKTLGVSKTKVENARAVLKDEGEAKAVLSGETTLNQASKKARAKKPKAAESKKPEAARSKKPKPFNATEAFMKIHEYILDAMEKWPQCERRTFARKLLGVAEELKRETGLVMQEITIDAKAG